MHIGYCKECGYPIFEDDEINEVCFCDDCGATVFKEDLIKEVNENGKNN